jgi:signal transduction histidine kinase
MGILWGLGFEDLFFKDHPAVSWYASIILSPFFGFFLIHSVRHFLKTFTRFARWDTYLVVLSFAQAIAYWFAQFAPAFLYRNLSPLSDYITVGSLLLMCLSLLFTIFLYRREKDKVVRLELYALAPFAITLSINIIFFLFNSIKYFKTVNEAVTEFMFALQQVNHVAYNVSQVWMIILFACVLFMRFSSLRKKVAQQEVEKEKDRNALIAQQKIELEKQVTERTSELQQSLENLKSTQKQLIQSEKMASLGELTAGIAHEIQNPLNFVNNFSEVNKELLDEMKDEMKKGNLEEADSIANDVIENEQKINHHGKRADAIVKGMLQHSRVSTGQKELTDINALADEYLRLSYHGLRAKDKSFNAEMKTDFDESIGKINIIPQDIGRVLLNLFNNSFYAVNEQKNRNPESYKPTVSVTTKKSENSVLITVSDNGNGIPQKVVDKIFQPFFTTKPTGEGTGLGLSLAYDIVNAHGGELKVETHEGQGTEFTIQLPIKTI